MTKIADAFLKSNLIELAFKIHLRYSDSEDHTYHHEAHEEHEVNRLISFVVLLFMAFMRFMVEAYLNS